MSAEKKTAAGAAARKRRAQVVDDLLQKIEEQLGKASLKATLADYIRLVQLRKDLETEEPRDIKVSWVENPKK